MAEVARRKARGIEIRISLFSCLSPNSVFRQSTMVFGRKKSIGAQDSPPPPPLPSKSSSLFSSSKSKKLAYPEPISEGKVHLDDWGRMSGNLPPAFVSGGAGTSGGNHYGVGEDELVENSLIYGYTAIETEYECEIEGVLLAVRQIAEQIKTRGSFLLLSRRVDAHSVCTQVSIRPSFFHPLRSTFHSRILRR